MTGSTMQLATSKMEGHTLLSARGHSIARMLLVFLFIIHVHVPWIAHINMMT